MILRSIVLAAVLSTGASAKIKSGLRFSDAAVDTPRKLQELISVSSTPSLEIPDNEADTGGYAEVDLSVVDDCLIDSVTVTVGIDHSWVGDLTMTLTSPNGVTAGLVERPGLPVVSDSSNLASTELITFDDSSLNDPNLMGSAVGSGTAIAAETFYSVGGLLGPPIPAGANTLTNMTGGITQGTWTFTVADGAGGDIGTLQSITLDITATCVIDCNSFPCGNNGNKVQVCQVTPAKNGEHNVEICIAKAALQARLDAGDYCGPCQ